ncbi:hypothetical protein KP806_11210 [Paenibacillus sp. N4]|uniref:hypothetical protein n=1 Tax=Paenibacillus vietnamensis TaxID=2590547 RepID=UPI001CD096F3|nr:hypothetical protein [Paenibacillus vietnamensis]MCA0755623.1 hypothetical protein [Paenibacillus vietnamensis]
MKAGRIDEQLRAGRKALRTLPGALLLGSTGARLWADYLDPKPGFSGRFDFIHKVNIPLLYAVSASGTESFEPCRTAWYPSHLRMEYEDNRVSFREQKFITWDDCAVSFQSWTNLGTEELVLRLETYGDVFHQTGNGLYGTFQLRHLSFHIDAALVSSDEDLFREIRLKPGETKDFMIAAAFGISGQDLPDVLTRRACGYALSGRPHAETVADYIDAYNEWFEHIPDFRCSDPLLNKTWTYRWFLLRHNLADPKYGHLSCCLVSKPRSQPGSGRTAATGTN